jgi:hypothetical protein
MAQMAAKELQYFKIELQGLIDRLTAAQRDEA